jgi:hypothetical protein
LNGNCAITLNCSMHGGNEWMINNDHFL